MEKSVLMSLSPYYYYLIGEFIKNVDVRKVIPKDPNWNKVVECYMTKDMKSFNLIPKEFQEKYRPHMGKVGMRFVCAGIMQPFGSLRIMAKQSCLTEKELINYSDGKDLYGLRVSNLKVYDMPKELGKFRKRCSNFRKCKTCKYLDAAEDDYEGICKAELKKPIDFPPRSWFYLAG